MVVAPTWQLVSLMQFTLQYINSFIVRILQLDGVEPLQEYSNSITCTLTRWKFLLLTTFKPCFLTSISSKVVSAQMAMVLHSHARLPSGGLISSDHYAALNSFNFSSAEGMGHNPLHTHPGTPANLASNVSTTQPHNPITSSKTLKL